MRSAFKIILLTLIFGIHSVAVRADSGRIDLDFEIGFNNHFQLNTWTPLNVTLDNRGPETSGTLEVVVTSGSEYRGDVYQTTIPFAQQGRWFFFAVDHQCFSSNVTAINY